MDNEKPGVSENQIRSAQWDAMRGSLSPMAEEVLRRYSSRSYATDTLTLVMYAKERSSVEVSECCLLMDGRDVLAWMASILRSLSSSEDALPTHM